MPRNILTLLGMLTAVAAVLLLAYFTTRWIGKHGNPRYFGGGGDGDFRVLRQLSLGRDERLALVQLGERCLLLGVAAGRVTLLRELTEEESKAWLNQTDPPAPPSFWEAVQKNLPRRK